MNRRIPNGTYGGVRGQGLDAPSYSIRDLRMSFDLQRQPAQIQQKEKGREKENLRNPEVGGDKTTKVRPGHGAKRTGHAIKPVDDTGGIGRRQFADQGVYRRQQPSNT